MGELGFLAAEAAAPHPVVSDLMAPKTPETKLGARKSWELPF